ncbi:hypothetical protein ACFT0G_06175 [Streptomyces sp. NPDC057020]|uniref:hypothetical protein n=1 Tax=unclassified Streptomyces TaxID=2593676 RepID=UPI0036450C11
MQRFKGLRRLGRSFADLLRPSAPAETVIDGPTGDDIPAVDQIEAAAERHEEAREQYNDASRTKRAARRVLDRVPTGIYGPWAVSWVQPTRRDWDRDAIADFYQRHGEEIPTKLAAPMLKLTRVVTESTPAPTESAAALDVNALFDAAKPAGLVA